MSHKKRKTSNISSGWNKGQITYNCSYLFVTVDNASIKRIALNAY